ncbi:MAG: hypothetical protein Q7K57_01405 [Burkholderiaceae bacterium]|nr:hypothetical protein [Burkholderiaceae bacterium]
MKNSRHLAALNELSLKELQSLARLLSQQQKNACPADNVFPSTGQQAQSVVEITVGVPPLQLVDQVLAAVSSWQLREFLSAVVIEPEVELALITPIPMLNSSRGACQPFQSYPVQTLRRAAEMAGYWCAFGQEERAVLFVATLIRGIQHLLADYVVGPANLYDILFTLVRPALHRLDDSAPRQACLLRLCLGWGNADEVDAYYVPRLQESVERALRAVQLGQAPQRHARLCYG